MADKDEFTMEIVVPNPDDVVAWAKEHIPGAIEKIEAWQQDDDRYRCRIHGTGKREGAALKLVWHERKD